MATKGPIKPQDDFRTAKKKFERMVMALCREAYELEVTGIRLQEQFPDSAIQARLTEDARRIRVGAERTLETLREG